MRAAWIVVVLGVVASACGPSKRDVQLERAAKANWARSLMLEKAENAEALAAWRTFCRACAPDAACSAEERTIRTDPRHAQAVIEASLCEAPQYEDYRSKPGFLR